MSTSDTAALTQVLGLGVAAFTVHALFSKRKSGQFSGYGQGPGPTIYDPRPAAEGDVPDDEEDEEEGSDEDEEEAEDEEDDLDFDPGEIIKGGLPPSDDDPPPKPEGGFKPGTPEWFPSPTPEGTPEGGYFPGIIKGGDGGRGGTKAGGQWTFPIGQKAAPASGGPVRIVPVRMGPPPAANITSGAGGLKPALAGFYGFNPNARAAPVVEKILVTVSAYLIVTGLYEMAKKRSR